MTDLVTSAEGFLSRIGGALSSAGTGIAQGWQSAVDNLRAKAKEFADLYKWLQTKAIVVEQAGDIALKSDYDTIMSKAVTVKSYVERITGGIDWATGKLQSMFGVSPDRTMGALPLIPIAVISLAVAAIVGWLTEAYKVKAKIDYIESHNLTPSQASRFMGGDLLSGLNWKTLGGIVLAGAAVWYFTRERKA